MGAGRRRSRIATMSPVNRIAAAATISAPMTQAAQGKASCQKVCPCRSRHCAAGGHTEIPLSSPPPLEPGAGHSPPQENQSATPHTISAPVATTTANPTVGPSTRLGLALLTAAKIRRVVRRKPGAAPAEAASSVKSLRALLQLEGADAVLE